MATPQLIDQTNATALLVQSSGPRTQRDSGSVQIDVVAAAGTFTRAAGDFLADGFYPGYNITTSGFTNGGNNGSFVIDSVTATVITVTDNTGLADETGGGDEQVVTPPADGNVFFNMPEDRVEMITAEEVANIDYKAASGALQIDVVAAAGTFTRSTGSFIDDGFGPGQSVDFANFTNGGNNTTKVIQSVTALVITVTDNSGLVDETGSGDETATSTASEANPLTDALGFTMRGLYNFENQERRRDETLRRFLRASRGRFRQAGAYEFVSGNALSTDGSNTGDDRTKVRSSGWVEYADTAGTQLLRIYHGVRSLNAILSTSRPYYAIASATDEDTLQAATWQFFNRRGPVDEAVQTYGTSGAIQIDVVAAGGTFTRSTGSFLDDGFSPGQSVTFSGFTNGGNNVTKVISTVTATVITVTDNTGLADETGGGDEVVVFDNRNDILVTRVRTWGQNPGEATSTASGVDELGAFSAGYGLGETINTENTFIQGDVRQLATGTITIDAAAAGTFTRTSGSFLDDGFAAGATISVSGYVAGGNNSTFVIDTVTDTVITVTDNTGMVTEAGDADESIVSVVQAPWTGMTLTELGTPQTETGFNESDGDFTWVLANSGSGTVQQAAAWLDAASITDGDIDNGAGNYNGFEGRVWYIRNSQGKVVTQELGGKGLFIEGIGGTSEDQNIIFTDDSGATKTYPFFPTIEIDVGAVAITDPNAWWEVHISDGSGLQDHDTAQAVTLNDKDGVPMRGNVATDAVGTKISRQYDYQGNTQAGLPGGVDRDCFVKVEGDGVADQAVTEFTIVEQTTVPVNCQPGADNNA